MSKDSVFIINVEQCLFRSIRNNSRKHVSIVYFSCTSISFGDERKKASFTANAALIFLPGFF